MDKQETRKNESQSQYCRPVILCAIDQSYPSTADVHDDDAIEADGDGDRSR